MVATDVPDVALTGCPVEAFLRRVRESTALSWDALLARVVTDTTPRETAPILRF
jgi:hypothetical protein